MPSCGPTRRGPATEAIFKTSSRALVHRLPLSSERADRAPFVAESPRSLATLVRLGVATAATVAMLGNGCATPHAPPPPSRRSIHRRPAPARLVARPSRVQFVAQSGLNLPWISYGHDVGWPRRPGTNQLLGFRFYPGQVARRTKLPKNMHLIRVWAFGDDRAGNLAGRDPAEFATRCRQDLSALMDAMPADQAVIVVLSDFMLADGRGSPLGGKAGEQVRLVHDPDGARRVWGLLRPCLVPIQRRYGDRIIWEVMNEPLNGRYLTVTDASARALTSFLWFEMKHILSLGGRVTLGARSIQALRQTWAPVIRRAASFLRSRSLAPDHLVVQFHHYPGQELHPTSSLRTFTAHRLRMRLGLDPDTPILLGEARPESGFTMTDYRAMGLAGVLFWQDSHMPLDRNQVRRLIAQIESSPPAEWRPVRAARLQTTKPTGSTMKATQRTTATKPRGPTTSKAPKQTDPKPAPTSHRATRRTTGIIRPPLHIALSSCRIVQGPASTRWWRRHLGFAAKAFTKINLTNGRAVVQMEVDAHAPSPSHLFWHEQRRNGQVLCDLPQAPMDLTHTEIAIAFTPPDQARTAQGGSGVQVIAEDNRGRRLHGPWTSLSSWSSGMERIFFRPPRHAVPGIGFRQEGFDLTHVQSVGLLWAPSTFAKHRYSARLVLSQVGIRPLCADRTAAPDGKTGSSRSCREAERVVYRTEQGPAVRIVRIAAADFHCAFHASDYPYMAAATVAPTSRSRVDHEQLVSRRGGCAPDACLVDLRLDPRRPFMQKGAVLADLTKDCSRPGGGLVDLRSCRIQFDVTAVGSTKPDALSVQPFLIDGSRRTCYLPSQVVSGSPISLGRFVPGCATRLDRISHVGLAFSPHHKAAIHGQLRLGAIHVTCAKQP